MASLRMDSGGNYLVTFRWHGKEYKRELATKAEDVASQWLARVNETLMRLKKSWVAVPEGVDLGLFIASGSEARKAEASREPADAAIIRSLFERFVEAELAGEKEATAERLASELAIRTNRWQEGMEK